VSEVPVASFGDTLREAHETYRHLVEGIPAVLYVDANDERSTNIYTSPQVEPLFGFTVERGREDPDLWLDHIHEGDRERVLCEHRESLRTGEPFRTEYRFRTAADRVVWLRDEAVLVRDDDGEPSFCGYPRRPDPGDDRCRHARADARATARRPRPAG
jgi:PAS domain S-box-containing protein